MMQALLLLLLLIHEEKVYQKRVQMQMVKQIEDVENMRKQIILLYFDVHVFLNDVQMMMNYHVDWHNE